MEEKMTHTYHFSAVIEKDSDGYYAYCPELQGCCTQGKNYEEAWNKIADPTKIKEMVGWIPKWPMHRIIKEVCK